MNEAAIKILSRQPNVYIFDSVYDMSRVRPDRTLDGTHFGFERPKVMTTEWYLCSEKFSFGIKCKRPIDGT